MRHLCGAPTSLALRSRHTSQQRPAPDQPMLAVVSREHHALFSDVIELAGAVANPTSCVCDLTAMLQPAAMDSCENFDNHAG